MRGLATTLLLLLAAPAAAGPIRVGIDVGGEVRDPFVVSVTGHYASIHNGTSRRWKEVPLRAGPRRFIPLGPVNLLLNMGVSVSIYHPEYVAARERSHKTPLLLRPVGFETFRPRAWRRTLAEGGEFENGGPDYALGQILGHFQAFLLIWLPAIDAADDELQASDESLRAYLPLFEELARFAMTEAAAKQSRRFAPRNPESGPAYLRSIEKRDMKTRAEVRDLLHRIREWVSVPRAERVVVRRLMEEMRYGRYVHDDLMREGDRARIGAFLDRYREDVAAQLEPEPATSWTNPESRVEYRVRVLDPPRRCSYLSITTDLTGVVGADLGDMTNQVKARFCRRESGEWRYWRS